MDQDEAIEFARRGLVVCDVHHATLEGVNEVLSQLKRGAVKGRVVIDLVQEK